MAHQLPQRGVDAHRRPPRRPRGGADRRAEVPRVRRTRDGSAADPRRVRRSSIRSTGSTAPVAPGRRMSTALAFEFCENGAKASSWEATTKVVGPEFFAEHSVADLEGRSDHWLEAQGQARARRCTSRRGRHALRAVVVGPRAGASSPTRCGRCPTRIARSSTRRAGRRTRPPSSTSFSSRRLGTNNLPDCSNMCHESSGLALDPVDRHRQGHREPRGHHRLRGPHRRSSDRTRARTTRGCCPSLEKAKRRGARSSASTRCRRPA